MTIDLPGIKRENIKLNYDRGVLTITVHTAATALPRQIEVQSA